MIALIAALALPAPLASAADPAAKPAAKPKPKAPPKPKADPVQGKDGVWTINYVLLGKTKLPDGKPAVFDPRLKKLNGKKVSVTGFVQPFEDADDMWSFMLIRYPVGCWYCEAPGPATIVLVEMPEDKELDDRLTNDAITVTGTLELNEEDPEDFLYIVIDATAVRAKAKPYVPPEPTTRRRKPRHIIEH